MSSTSTTRTRTLIEAALLLAVATMLSFFPKFEGIWANGGSITVCSMLPIILVSYRHGIKWGLATGLCFSLMQMVTGSIWLPAGGLLPAVFGLLLDYILPYTLIGLGGIFKGKLKNNVLVELICGTVFVLLLRYTCHVISGYVLWKSLVDATEFLSTPGFGLGNSVVSNYTGDTLCLLYSFIYNGSYMLPELIITTIGASFLSRFALYNLSPTNK
jgi:Predicted membrane protein